MWAGPSRKWLRKGKKFENKQTLRAKFPISEDVWSLYMLSGTEAIYQPLVGVAYCYEMTFVSPNIRNCTQHSYDCLQILQSCFMCHIQTEILKSHWPAQAMGQKAGVLHSHATGQAAQGNDELLTSPTKERTNFKGGFLELWGRVTGDFVTRA